MNTFEKANGYMGIFSKLPSQTPTGGEPDGPLFGNGDIGVTAGGSTDNLTFWISKNDIWHATYTHKAECEGAVKSLGTLNICSDLLKDADFSAKQRIGTADVEIDLKKSEYHLNVQSYAPYQQSLVVVKLCAVKGNIPLNIGLSPIEDKGAVCTCVSDGNIFRITKDYIGEAVEWETKSAAVCRIIGWDNFNGILHEGESILLALSVRTNHDDPDYLNLSETDIANITPETLEQYRREHEEWWKSFWASSGIEIHSEPDIEKFWYGSHYLMACCCKAGKFAPGIFGNWITTNKPNWAGDYHLNYNYEAPWWGVYSSNKVELSEPYDKPLMDYIPQARENARVRLNCRGIYSKVGIGPFGFETSRMYNLDGSENNEAPYWGQKSNSAYAAVNMVMRFYSTWDEEYARKYALPYMREVADFWEDYLKFEDGRYVIYNDCIHENSAAAKGMFEWVSDNTVDYSGDFNPILTLGLLRMVFRALIDMSEYLGTDSDRREKWEHILANLSDFPTQQREGKTVFRYTERGMDWCDGNSLGIQHIFPSGTIGLSSDEKLLKIARDTITVMHRWSDYNAFPTFFTAAARVGYDPNIILEKFKEQFMTHSFPNLFIYYGGGGIECCSAVPSCINEMLFQSHEGIIRLFPVWNREKDAAFQDLRGYGAFVVSAALRNGSVEDVSLISEKGRICSILCPWDSGMIILKDGVKVDYTTKEIKDGIVYTFKTENNCRYDIRKN